MSVIGKSYKRQDGFAKVTGRARYVDDIPVNGLLHAKVFRSSIANGRVLSINTTAAKALPGVVGVFTYEDAPKHCFPTAGHPWSLDVHHQDIADRRILNDRVRYVGDEIAVVIAKSEFIAERGVDLITAEYEEYPVLLSPEAALAEGATEIHDGTKNVVGSFAINIGEFADADKKSSHHFTGKFSVPVVQHCAMENHSAYAYIDENSKITVVSSTQIPYVTRRIVGQALGIAWGKVRLIKPFVGGGFGSKQDSVLEALVAFCTQQLCGRPVRLQFTREETFVSTRTRHAMNMYMETGVTADGILAARKFDVHALNGAYASHGQSICSKTMTTYAMLYGPKTGCSYNAKGTTVYTNMPVAGAMRGYGAPQAVFAVESHMEDIARGLKLDPIDFRLKNITELGWVSPSGMEVRSIGLKECILKGKELIKWDERKARYASQSGNIRRGLGMAAFAYATGVFPISVEIEAARIMMNDDGSMQLQIGATEIGQGSDTAFAQMAAETIGVPFEYIYVVSHQDTDVTPLGLGAYASRQSYSTGLAVRKAATEIRAKVVQYAAANWNLSEGDVDVVDGWIMSNGKKIVSLAELALHSHCNNKTAAPISADVSHNPDGNPTAYGATFVDLEVDIALGKVTIKDIINIHDSGKILNPQLAEGQVHGGMSMAIGYALYEQLLIDAKGHVLNENLLDYKLMTFPDTPDLQAAFVETYDPAAPYGNKALGEPPTCSPAAAIRNAILDATNVAFNSLPITPQKMIEGFTAAGLITPKEAN